MRAGPRTVLQANESSGDKISARMSLSTLLGLLATGTYQSWTSRKETHTKLTSQLSKSKFKILPSRWDQNYPFDA